MLHQHDGDEDGVKQLIVIPAFEADAIAKDLPKRVEQIFSKYNVQTIPNAGVPEFAKYVDQTAH
jgi:hypothetical protein